jgi:hypothetical protein
LKEFDEMHGNKGILHSTKSKVKDAREGTIKQETFHDSSVSSFDNFVEHIPR